MYLETFNEFGGWDKHPKFKSAVKKIEKELKKDNVDGGGKWVLDFLGDEYPQNSDFARRVIINATKNIT